MASAPLVRAGDGARPGTSWKLRNVRLVPFDVNDLPRRLGGAARSAVLAASLAAAALPCAGMTGEEPAAAPAGTLVELAGDPSGRYRPLGPRADSAAAGRSQPVRVASRPDRARMPTPGGTPSAPDGWAAFACGLAVLAFMARRKLSASAA